MYTSHNLMPARGAGTFSGQQGRIALNSVKGGVQGGGETLIRNPVWNLNQDHKNLPQNVCNWRLQSGTLKVKGPFGVTGPDFPKSAGPKDMSCKILFSPVNFEKI